MDKRAFAIRCWFQTLASALAALVILSGCRTKEAAEPAGGEPLGVSHRKITEAGQVTPDAPIDVSGVIRRVHFAYRPEGTSFSAGHTSYSVRVVNGEITLRPFLRSTREAVHRVPNSAPVSPASAEPAQASRSQSRRREAAEILEGAPLRLETTSIRRGEGPVIKGLTGARVAPDGSLELSREAVRERLLNSDQGVEQRWHFATRPVGQGDLVLRVRAAGLQFAGASEEGLHFEDPATGLGFRYGRATWVDGAGERTSVSATFADGTIVLTVPARLLERSAYPAVLDPVISSEFGMDNPILSTDSLDAVTPSVAVNGSTSLVVWADDRGGQLDIYGALVDSYRGSVLTSAGLPISIVGADQSSPAASFDGSNYFVVWEDRRNGTAQIYGTRVDLNGVALDLAGINIASAGASPAVAWSGSNHLVVWQAPNGDGGDIAGARVTQAGLVTPLAVPVSNSSGPQLNPAVIWNQSSFLVVWEDDRTGQGFDIMGSRVNDLGDVMDPAGRTISAAPYWQIEPALAQVSSTVLVTWQDRRNNNQDYDIYGALVDPAGQLQNPDFAIASSLGDQTGPAATFNSFYFLVAWTDGAAGNGDVYGARVSMAGAVLDSPIPIATGANSQVVRAIGAGGLVLWTQQNADIGNDIVGARVDHIGILQDPNGIPISRVANRQERASVAFDGTNYLVVWSDFRNGTRDIYGARVSPTGALQDPAGIPICTAPGEEQFHAVAAGTGGFLVAWEDGRNGAPDIYAARVPSQGLPGPAFPVTTAEAYQRYPGVAWNGSNYLVVWQDYGPRTNWTEDVWGRLVDAAGSLQGTGEIPVSTAPGNQLYPVVASNGSGFMVAWWDFRNTSLTSTDIYGARLDASGGVLDPSGIAIQNSANMEAYPGIASNGSGYLVLSADYSTSSIVGTRVDVIGGVQVGSARAVANWWNGRTNPAAAWTGSYYLAAWQDTRSGKDDIYIARVNPDGTSQDGSGLLLTVGPASYPKVISAGGSRAMIVYNKTALGTQRILGKLFREESVGAGNGSACTLAQECESGYCVDGVCCDQSCGAGADDCLACSIAAGGLADGLCTHLAPTVSCRLAQGPCDLPEYCDGFTAYCPVDALWTSDHVCRGAAGGCDIEERCDGSSASCPADEVASADTVCRPAAGDCDSPEFCTGAESGCPSDAYLASTVVCRPAAGACDLAESCTGNGPVCPDDVFLGTETICRPAAGICDLQENCPGNSADCPTDSFAGPSVTCRPAGGACDLPEVCGGVAANCPQNALSRAGSQCGGDGTCICDSAGACLTYDFEVQVDYDAAGNRKTMRTGRLGSPCDP